MKPNTFALALVTATTALPASTHAADDFCSRIFIYAINQFCQQLPNSQSLCQPIGLAGPAPGCNTTSAQPLIQVPLGPPGLQMTPFSPLAAAPMAVYSPATSTPPPPDAAAPLKPAATAAVAVDASELTVLMPATASTDNTAAVAIAVPPAPAVVSAPKTPAPPIEPAAVIAPAPASGDAANAVAVPVAAPQAPEIVAESLPAVATTMAGSTLVAAETVETAPSATAGAQNRDAHENALAHFEFDSAKLTEAGRAMLDTWLALATHDLPIQVTGHADRLGPEPYNEKLSLRRAEAVKKYLTAKGKPANRVHILAKGEAMPVISCAGDANPDTKACLAPNRRAEIAAGNVTKKTTESAHRRMVRPAKSKHSK